MSDSETRLITPGVIADRPGEPLHRVLRMLATRPHIHPLARAGTLRLYPDHTVTEVERELRAIDARKGVTHHGGK